MTRGCTSPLRARVIDSMAHPTSLLNSTMLREFGKEYILFDTYTLKFEIVISYLTVTHFGL